MRKTTQSEIDGSRKDFQKLSEALASLETGDEVAAFLRELCTPAECVDFAKRWQLVRELLKGKTQRAIAAELGMSLCKITRGARYVKRPDSMMARLLRADLISRPANPAPQARRNSATRRRRPAP